MKYFTLGWWSGEVEDANAAFEAYKRYLESVSDSLPRDLYRLAREVSLHDAHLRRLDVSMDEKQLVLQLDGCGFDEATKSYFGRRFCLTYANVRSIMSTADPKSGLPGPHGYGDLGYDELEVISSEVYEHRILFSTGIEINIQFSKFTLEYENADY